MRSRSVHRARSAHSQSLLLFTLLWSLFCASSAMAQTVVYDSLTTGSKFYGHGAYSLNNATNGDAALGYGSFPAYMGGSPAFEFVPSGIPAGDNLTGFKAGIGNDYITGVYDFHLTLFTSGPTEDTNPSDWTRLGSWGGQTDGQYNSGAGGAPSLASVTANLPGGNQLTDGDHYYLMATADANQGINGSGNNYLDWGVNGAFPGYGWEPLLTGYQTAPLQYTSTGVFQVLVGPSTSSVPEPAFCQQIGALLLVGGLGLVRYGLKRAAPRRMRIT